MTMLVTIPLEERLGQNQIHIYAVQQNYPYLLSLNKYNQKKS